ncbi:MAG: S8 family serine peptidase [Candidatus Thorarchaeota archaeon]
MKRRILMSVIIFGLALSLLIPIVTTRTQMTVSSELMKKIALNKGNPQRVLIETIDHDYSSVISEIESSGGTVFHSFKHVNGLSAEISPNTVTVLRSHYNVKKISVDEFRYPSAIDDMALRNGAISELNVEEDQIVGLTPDQIEALVPLMEPNTYWNPIAMGAGPVWGTGNFGQDSLVVIIDTGVFANHALLGWYPYGPVIGGVDLTSDVGTEFEGFDNPYNHWHGTHVAGIVAGAGGILVHSSDPLYKAIAQYAAPPPEASSIGYPGYHIIPLFGVAPLAQIYGIKVFDHTGAGVPESDIINAIDFAIDLHDTGAYDVDVISMSLGGGTGYDGRDLEDQTVDLATSKGITVVTSAGNDGPASESVGSPGTAHTSIAVGAAAHPVNTRVFWDNDYGIPGIGHQLFVSDTPQIYAFSSRGPTADGRFKPTLSATGIFVLSAYIHPAFPGASLIAWASGTSMSCPAVSGAVALLNTVGEGSGASPYDYKEALREGATWLPGFDEIDQGAGYLNAGNSMNALMNDPFWGTPHPPIPAPAPNTPVPPKGMNTGIVGSGTFTYSVKNLDPGLAKHFYIEVTEATDSITIDISNVRTVRNPYGLNTFELYVGSAVRSGYDYFLDSANVYGEATFWIEDYSTTWIGATYFGGDWYNQIIQPGYMEIVLENDWTSAGRISGEITITVTEETEPQSPNESYFGTLVTGAGIGWIPVGYGTDGVIVELWWENDWTKYPTSDLDMIILWDDGIDTHVEVSGASLRSPEGVFIDSQDIQWVLVLLLGYETYGNVESWNLRVYYV